MSTLQSSTLRLAKSFRRWRIVHIVRAIVQFLGDIWHRLTRPGEDSAGLEYAGKPVPRRPSPTHHLTAAKALPPADKTYLFPKD